MQKLVVLRQILDGCQINRQEWRKNRMVMDKLETGENW